MDIVIERKRRKLHPIFKTLIVIALAFALFLAVFFIFAPRFVIITDSAWSLVMPHKEFARTSLNLALRWQRLKIIEADISVLSNSKNLEDFITNLSTNKKITAILFGPLASSQIMQYNIDASSTLNNSVVYGISNTQNNFFDITLCLNPQSGWEEASKTIAEEASSMSQNVTLVTDNMGKAYRETIVSQFPTNMVTEYINENESRFFISNTIEEMKNLNTIIAFCPHLKDFYSIFSQDDTISWVVDYKYSTIVPKKQLYGIVLPNLSLFAKTAVIEKPQTKQILHLDYKYSRGL